MIAKSKKLFIIEFLASLIFGLAVFVWFFGLTPLDVTNDSWILLHNGDLAEHYFGWRFFRQSSWLWPLGSVENVAFPDIIPIMYLDCIPWVAILFKILSPILPSTFQYMGIYELFCFCFQIYLGEKITEYFVVRSEDMNSQNFFISILMIISGGILLGLCAPMIFRVFYHVALSSHYIFLLIILLWIKRSFFDSSTELLFWGLLGVLGVMTHLFFVPIAGILVIGVSLTEYFRKHSSLVFSFSIVLSYVCGSFLAFGLLNGFAGKFNPGAFGVGFYSSNLNSLFNSMNYSTFLAELPLATDGQYEGFSYLGLGWIVLSIVSFIILIIKYRELDIKSFKAFLFGFLFIYVCSFLAASGPIISFNEHVIFNIDYIKPIKTLLDIFRSHGRFTWAVIYLFPFFSIGIIIKYVNSCKIKVLILLVCLTIQIVDFIPWTNTKDSYTGTYNRYMVSDDNWNTVANNISYITYIPGGLDYSQHPKLFELAEFVLDNNLAIDNYYYARPRDEYVNMMHDILRTRLDNGDIIKGTAIVFDDPFEPMNTNWKLHYYCIDNYVIGTSISLPEINEFSYDSGIPVQLNIPRNFDNAYIDNNRIIIKNGGSVAGPEWRLAEGHYSYFVSGENISNIYLMYSGSIENGDLENIETTVISDDTVRFDFDLTAEGFGMNFYIVNDENEAAYLDSARIIKEQEYSEN